MLKKLMTFAGLLGGSVLFSGQALAAADWGPCTSTSGVHVFSATINETVTDVSKNTSGAIFPDFFTWDLGGQYAGVCECPSEGTASVLYKTTVPLALGHISGDDHYYIVNDHIQIATSIYIGGGVLDYKAVPFENLSNDRIARNLCDVNSDFDGGFTTGSKGKLSLYINHPFVGELIIPSTKIVDLFGSYKKDVYSSSPLASVTLSGAIIVPQGCELSSGSTLEIPFGEFQSHDFKDRKGQMPTGATSITKELQFKCTNISDGVIIYLHIEGTPNENDSNAISMGNPDIGAIIKGESGNVLVPNSIAFEQEMNVSDLVDETHRVASTKLTFEPISTTGKMPTTGDYEGIATLRIDVE
jgi:type 1 fimbria pilin